MTWRVRPTGVLDALKKERVEAGLDFVKERRGDILRVALASWGVLLLGVFTLLLTIRLALTLPL
jgi:hypothetical protein